MKMWFTFGALDMSVLTPAVRVPEICLAKGLIRLLVNFLTSIVHTAKAQEWVVSYKKNDKNNHWIVAEILPEMTEWGPPVSVAYFDPKWNTFQIC